MARDDIARSALAAALSEDERSITMSRLIGAPRELVWRAFSDPRHLIRWWGPNGFTNTVHEMDFRPGGVWRMTMHGPDGTDYPNYSVFEEIRPPEYVSYWHGSNEQHPREFFASIRLADEGGGTRVILNLTFDSAEACERVKAFGAVEGGQQTLARLDDFVQSLKS